MNSYLIQDYLERAVQAHPEKTAITDGNSSLNYSELEVLSNRIANLLLWAGVLPGHKVGVFSGRSPAIVAAIMGVLKTGATYVPVDPKTPLDRLINILADCNPTAIIIDEKTKSILKVLIEKHDFSCPVLDLSIESNIPSNYLFPYMTLDDLYQCNASKDQSFGAESDICYVIYTSGSTGVPKGVQVTHGNVKHYIEWITEYLGLKSEDRILGTAPFHFDMSVFDIFATLRASATLCLAADNLLLFPEMLAQYIEREKTTVWKGVSSLLSYMNKMGAVQKGRMPTLRTVAFAGEHLPTSHLMDWMTIFPEKEFFNAYGPTETTGVAVCHRIDEIPSSTSVKVPIGRPRANTKLLILDDNGDVASLSDTGELFIGGPGVATGYLNDPRKTKEQFVSHPLDPDSSERYYRTGDLVKVCEKGYFEFVGRRDGQVKVMGYRIELGEIEDCLHSVRGVEGACVLLINGAESSVQELVAFVETVDATEADIFNAMKNQLPHYMLPKHIQRIERLPRCSRGKVSRQELKEIFLAEKGTNT